MNTRCKFHRIDNNKKGKVWFDDVKIVKGNASQTVIVEESNYYPFGLKHKGYNNVVNGTANPYKYSGKEHNQELGLDWYDFGARNYDASLGRWMNIDNKAEKYMPVSPYNYVLNNPMRYVDPDGEDVYLIIWASHNGRIGHAGIAVDNYKTQNKKDAKGNDILDKNGNPITEQVKDGTVTYYDLWPGGAGAGKDNFDKDVTGLYNETVTDLKTLMNTDITGAEGQSPDGVVQLTTDQATDDLIKNDLADFKKNNPNYNGVKCNCSNYAKIGTERATTTDPKKMDNYASEKLGKYNSMTPNQLYKAISTQSNAKVLKNPKGKVNHKFIDAVTNGNAAMRKLANKRVND